MASFMLHVYMYVCVGIYNKIFKNVKKKKVHGQAKCLLLTFSLHYEIS